MPGYPVARDVPKAQELPDPTTVYKVAFSVAQEAPEPGGVNPMLETVARYVNTLAKYGVPAENRQIAVTQSHGLSPRPPRDTTTPTYSLNRARAGSDRITASTAPLVRRPHRSGPPFCPTPTDFHKVSRAAGPWRTGSKDIPAHTVPT